MSAMNKPMLGTTLPLVHQGSGQYTWKVLGNRPNLQCIGDNNALFAGGIGPILHKTTAPVTGAQGGAINTDLIEDSDAVFVLKAEAASLLSFKPILGRDGADPNNRMAQFAVVGWRELRLANHAPEWIGSVLYVGYAVAGDTNVQYTGSRIRPATGALSAYELNWADTIGGTDYTVGDSAKVMHDMADGAATLLLDFDGHPLIGIYGTCLTDGSHGTAAGAFGGLYSFL